MENEFFSDRTPKRNQQIWSEGEIINLIKMRESNLTEKVIAGKLGRTFGSVHRKTQELLESGEYFVILDELEMDRVH
ncbi:hypothetical protein [Bacillus sp. FJAT-49736]|uniref:hypothetical protein n=1 Tax=Bacillus sp. FJAT-49736 TaxID=2833582 RepID=UPI001BC92E22|nr:hypothetical protein [Bacillus sp. FJAT-49736]MBS4171923.1 hypothetical protein [Bacillus sp. FJAT-49736]